MRLARAAETDTHGNKYTIIAAAAAIFKNALLVQYYSSHRHKLLLTGHVKG